MRPQPITIKLGEAQWRVRPLTLRQIQEIEPLLLDPQVKQGSVAAAIEIVAIGLSRDYPDAAANLHELEASAHDLRQAMVSLLELGGFILQAENEPGEALAGAD